PPRPAACIRPRPQRLSAARRRRWTSRSCAPRHTPASGESPSLQGKHRAMREIIFDTETTGLSAVTDRLVEIGCVELVNHIPTGRTYHTYLCPDCAMSAEAEAVHGLSLAFLADKPRFAEIAGAFLEFIGEAPLVAHNAQFDFGFINAELARVERPPL